MHPDQDEKPKGQRMEEDRGFSSQRRDAALDSFFYKMASLLGKEQVLRDEPMYKHTTFRIGGPADLFVMPRDVEEAAAAVALCRQEGIPFEIIGNGSNLLVSDAGIRGVVVQMYRNLQSCHVDGLLIHAQAGVLLAKAAADARDASLEGLAFAAGIPGTVGGAVVMNAGAYGSEIKDVLKRVCLLTKEGEIKWEDASALELGYRSSRIKEDGSIVLEAVFELTRGDRTQIAERMKELNRERNSKQPLEFPSAGSTFKRPPGFFAGKLIMDSALAGAHIGDAMVSPKHCGFIVNTGNATAADVNALIRHVQSTVSEKFGVWLEPEVRFLGDF